DRILNSVLRKIGFDKVFTTGTGTDICIKELSDQLMKNVENNADQPLYITACPAWVKFAEQFIPSVIPQLSTIKSPQQLTGALIKTLIASQADIKPEKIFSVSATPCMAMKFEARREGMVRKGISDVDSVMTVRELARLIRLYGIDVSNIEPEPADDPLAGRSSAAALAEVSGGMAEAIIRSVYYRINKKDLDKQNFKRLRSGAAFRESTFNAGDREINVAVVDGLTGLPELRKSMDSGKKYDLIEVMTCPGGCVNGAGLPFSVSGNDKKNRAKMIYQADEADPINLPCKSPLIIYFYDKTLKENSEISDSKIFHIHFEKRNVLL
ncbi:MAG: iron hydrogenase small subunit, partial [Bacteroidales bacterium]|nr:iron hydrogenase small subunit [Bacteroidales bacterium]